MMFRRQNEINSLKIVTASSGNLTIFSRQNEEENKKHQQDRQQDQRYQTKIKRLKIAATSTSDLMNVLETIGEEATVGSGIFYTDPGTNIGSNIPSNLCLIATLLSTCEYYAGEDEAKKAEVKELAIKLLDVVNQAIEERPYLFGRNDEKGKENREKSLQAIFKKYLNENIHSFSPRRI